MARTGLRMMPTFPSSPLKFRTVGFPQYGFKVGLSEGAFPTWTPNCRVQLVCLPPSCSPLPNLDIPALCRLEHRHLSSLRCSTPGVLAPVRVILSRSINTYSTPSAPLAGTSRLHRLAAYTRCLRCAYSHRSRRPTTGSELSLMLFRNMSSSKTTGNLSDALTQYFTENTGLQLGIKVSAFPSSSHSDSGEVCVFEA